MSDVVLQDTMPAPIVEQRDEIGRMVALTWHGSGTGSGHGGPRWLVAVDGSDCSTRAVEMAAHVGARDEQFAAVDLLYVHSWLNKEAAETKLARHSWSATAPARRMLETKGIGWHLHARMGEEAPEIVRLAETLGSLGIVLGSRGLTATESVLLGSVALKVLHLSKTAILIVR